VNPIDKTIYFDSYRNYDIHYAWKITCNIDTGAFSVYNPVYGYICNNLEHNAVLAEIYFIALTPPEVYIPLSYINDNDVQYNLNIIFRYATSYTSTSTHAVVQDDNTLSIGKNDTFRSFTVTAMNDWGPSVSINIVSLKGIVVANYFAKYNNNIVTFDDHSGNERHFPFLEESFYDGVVFDTGVNETIVFVENYSNGWTLYLKFFANRVTTNTTIISTPVGNVELVNQRIRVTRNNVVILQDVNTVIVPQTWYNFTFMQNGTIYLDGIETRKSSPTTKIFNVSSKISISQSFDGSISSLQILKANILIHDVLMEIPFYEYVITTSSPPNTDVNFQPIFYSTPSSLYSFTNGVYLGEVETRTTQGETFVGEWLQIQLPHYVYLQKCVLIVSTRYYNSFPKTWVTVGSMDGVHWQKINHTLFELSNDGNYVKYLRVITTHTSGNTWVGIEDIRLYATKFIFPYKTQELGTSRVLTNDNVSYDLSTYMKNVIRFKYISTNTDADVNLSDHGMLKIQGTYENDTYSVFATGYNDFGGKTLTLVTRETLKHPLVVNGGLESFGIDKRLHTLERITIPLGGFFEHEFFYRVEISINHPGVIIDPNSNLVINRIYSNQEYTVKVFGISIDHEDTEFKISSTLSVSETIHPPLIIKHLEDEGIIRLHTNTIRFNLLEYFKHASKFETDTGELQGNELVITGNYRNCTYEVEVIGKTTDYLEEDFIIRSILTVSETIAYPLVSSINTFPNIGVHFTDTIKSYDLNWYFVNTQVYSSLSYTGNTSLYLELNNNSKYYTYEFEWNQLMNFTRDGFRKGIGLSESSIGDTELLTINFVNGWTIDINFKITKALSGFKRLFHSNIGSLYIVDGTKFVYNSFGTNNIDHTGLEINTWYWIIIQQNGMYSINDSQFVGLPQMQLGTIQSKYYLGGSASTCPDCSVEYVQLYNNLKYYDVIPVDIYDNEIHRSVPFNFTQPVLFRRDKSTDKIFTYMINNKGTTIPIQVNYLNGWTIDIMFKIIGVVVTTNHILFTSPVGTIYVGNNNKIYLVSGLSSAKLIYTGLKNNDWYRVILQSNGVHSINGIKYLSIKDTVTLGTTNGTYIIGDNTSNFIISHARVHNQLKVYLDSIQVYIVDIVGGTTSNASSFFIDKFELSVTFTSTVSESSYIVRIQTTIGQVQIKSPFLINLQKNSIYILHLYHKERNIFRYSFGLHQGYAVFHNISMVYANIVSDVNIMTWEYNPICFAESLRIDTIDTNVNAVLTQKIVLDVFFQMTSVPLQNLVLHTQCGAITIKDANIEWRQDRWYRILLEQSGLYTTDDVNYVYAPIKLLGSGICKFTVLAYQDIVESNPQNITNGRATIINNFDRDTIDANIYIYVLNDRTDSYFFDSDLNARLNLLFTTNEMGQSVTLIVSFGVIKLEKISGNFNFVKNTPYTLVLTKTNDFSRVYKYHFVGQENVIGYAKVHNDNVINNGIECIIDGSLKTLSHKEPYPQIQSVLDYTDGWTLVIVFKIKSIDVESRVLIQTPIGQVRFVDKCTRISFWVSGVSIVDYNNINVGRWYELVLRQDGFNRLNIIGNATALPNERGVEGYYRVFNRLELYRLVDVEIFIDLFIDTQQSVECLAESFFVDNSNGMILEFIIKTTTVAQNNILYIKTPICHVRILGGSQFQLESDALYRITLDQRSDRIIGSTTCQYNISKIGPNIFGVKGEAILNNILEFSNPFEIEMYINDDGNTNILTWTHKPSYGNINGIDYHVIDNTIEGVYDSPRYDYSNGWTIDVMFQVIETTGSTILTVTPFGNIVIVGKLFDDFYYDLSLHVNNAPRFTHVGLEHGVWYRVIIQKNGSYSINGTEYVFLEIIDTNYTLDKFSLGRIGNASHCRIGHFRIYNKSIGNTKILTDSGDSVDENMLIITPTYRNIEYFTVISASTTDYEGVTYTVSSFLKVIETIIPISLTTEYSIGYKQILLEGLEYSFNLENIFNYAETYVIKTIDGESQYTGIDYVYVRFQSIIIDANYRNTSYIIELEGKNIDFNLKETKNSFSLIVREDIEPPYIVANLSGKNMSSTILTNQIYTIDLSYYFKKATSYDFLVVDSLTQELLQTNGVSINNHILNISPIYRNITFDIVVIPKTINIWDVVYFISHHPNHIGDGDIIQKSTLFNVREGPPLPVPLNTRLSLTHMYVNTQMDFIFSSYFTGIFGSTFYKNGSTTYNSPFRVSNQYRNTILTYPVYARNDSGFSLQEFLFCIQEGSAIPTVKPGVQYKYILVSDNSVYIYLSDHFTGIVTFYTCNGVSQDEHFIHVDGSFKNKEYHIEVKAGNESGISNNSFTFRIIEGYDVCNTFVCRIYDSGYFGNNDTWFNNKNIDHVTYSSKFRSIGKGTNQYVTDFGYKTNYSIEWSGFFKAKNTGSYTFYLGSDDASLLWIDGLKTSNNGIHDTIEISYTVVMNANTYHKVKIQYGNDAIDSVCYFEFEGPNIIRTSIFDEYITWLPFKYFEIADGNESMHYSLENKVRFVNQEATKCIFTITSSPLNEYFTIMEVISGLHLKCTFDGVTTDTSLFLDNINPLNDEFYWKLLLIVDSERYHMYNKAYSKYVKFDLSLNTHVINAHPFICKINTDTNIVLKTTNNVIHITNFPFRLPVSNYIYNATSISTTDTDASLEANVKSGELDLVIRNPKNNSKVYNVSLQTIDKRTLITLRFIEHFDPILIREFEDVYIEANVVFTFNLLEYTSNVSIYSIIYSKYNNCTIYNNTLQITSNNRKTSYIILVQCSSEMSSKLLLCKINVTEK